MDYAFELKSLGYLAVAMLLGAVIGFERELADKPAGIRTHMLVAGAGALFVLLGDMLVMRFAKFGGEVVRADPIGIMSAIATGVAFLGAGTIIRRGGQDAVEGLTTAAALLFTAAVGVSVALKELVLASGATVFVLLTLRVVRAIEARLKHKRDKP